MKIKHQLRRIIPPVYFLVTLILMICLDRYIPIMILVPEILRYPGVALIVMGFCLSGWGAYTFKKADTPVKPFETSTSLVTTGPFRYSRNPMYLGMIIILIGTWCLLGTLAPLLLIAVFLLLIQEVFIKQEELFMQELFGAQYDEYKSNVRRWL